MQILMICQFLGVANGTAGSVMMAIDKHKPVAKWAIIEAVLNFTCSIILVKTIGLYGVACVHTTVALTFGSTSYFWPSYVRKVLEIPIHNAYRARLAEDGGLLRALRAAISNH